MQRANQAEQDLAKERKKSKCLHRKIKKLRIHQDETGIQTSFANHSPYNSGTDKTQEDYLRDDEGFIQLIRLPAKDGIRND